MLCGGDPIIMPLVLGVTSLVAGAATGNPMAMFQGLGNMIMPGIGGAMGGMSGIGPVADGGAYANMLGAGSPGMSGNGAMLGRGGDGMLGPAPVGGSKYSGMDMGIGTDNPLTGQNMQSSNYMDILGKMFKRPSAWEQVQAPLIMGGAAALPKMIGALLDDGGSEWHPRFPHASNISSSQKYGGQGGGVGSTTGYTPRDASQGQRMAQSRQRSRGRINRRKQIRNAAAQKRSA